MPLKELQEMLETNDILRVASDSGGYFSVKSFDEVLRPIPIGREHLEKIITASPEDRMDAKKALLNAREIDELIEYERRLHKIHVNVAPESRIDFVRKLLEAESQPGSPVVLNNWKVKRYFEQQSDPNQPDFVFYVYDEDSDTSKEKAELFAEHISKIVRDYEDSAVPMYSEPFMPVDKHTHLSLSIAQGNFDTKTYLRSRGILEDYYDTDSNSYLTPESDADTHENVK